ncbi:cytochrome P450 PksS [Archangium gephyra]|uniref:Cytochrome P450 PksS n=1 Tax=Archangium gephyra TaxID=48 RepID=A0AAC8TAE1_9BACT|nr:cytochrome P450 [Archangium gephyra]AKI98676.1 putative cytochrome P450 hydroxylase [Archangium gephyra]REG30604.1 cytochrome P450 PksS [Archangium gephyra]
MATNPPNEQQQETAPVTAPHEAPRADATHILDRTNPEFFERAHGLYSDLRALGPVVRAPMRGDLTAGAHAEGSPERQARDAGQERYFVTRYDESVSALLDDRLSSDFRTGLPPQQREFLNKAMPEEFKPIAFSLIMMDPPDHTRLRKLVQPNFTARAMEALEPRVQRLVDELLDKAEQAAAARGEPASERCMEFVEAFAYPLPVRVISDMLGIPEEDRAQVHAWAERLLHAETPAARADPQVRAGLKAFASYLEGLFERKRREPGEDMISQMVHAQEDGDRLSHQELLSMVFILFFAGHLTTVNLLGNGVVALLNHPEQHARFLADPAGMSKGMVEETLRYWGPVDYLSTPRIATESFALGDTQVPQGAKVSVGLASANRDPERFANPDAYDISRPDAHRNIAFGKGIHVCIGAPLARLEARIAFETLFRRFPKLRLAVPESELRWGAGAAMRGFNRIPLFF